jgi:type III secretion protein C
MKVISTLLMAALIAAHAVSANAASWLDRRFVYRAEGKKLAEVLQDFGGAQSIPVVIDPVVEGTVNANFNNRAEDFLNAIGKTYGLVWYFDGVTLFIYPSNAMQSQVFRLRGFDAAQVRSMLRSFGMGDARFPLRFNEMEQTLLAYGPPRHIELVASVIQNLEQASKERGSSSVRVVPLKHAVAADRVSGSSSVAGLATTLNNVFRGSNRLGVFFDTAQALREPIANLPGLAERRRAAEQTYGFKAEKPPADNKRGAEPADGKRVAGPATGEAASPAGDDQPFFEPDPNTNSIIIRASPGRMNQYVALVQRLDVAQNLVEIEATIIDVSTDEFESLGIDWEFGKTGRGRVSLSPGTPGTPTELGGTGAATSVLGANVTTLVLDAGRQLLARIRALEGKGKARVLARPKVLGAVNRTATMVDKRIASVRVAGNLDANLFTIEAGTTLQVQPQLIQHAERRDVKLTLFIQDGNFETNAVDQIPVIKRTEINTEATIREGESLLIGGISVESDSTGATGIPGLSKAPLLGGLFRNNEGSKFRSERLFLLTPKVVEVEGARTPETADATRALPTPSPRATRLAAGIEPALPQPPTRPAASEPGTPPAPRPAIAQQARVERSNNDCAANALGLSTKGCTNSQGGLRQQ